MLFPFNSVIMIDLSQTLTILSAMITPVVLIMASSSLIMSTSQRLSRSIERTRKITDAMKTQIARMQNFEATSELIVLFEQLKLSSARARTLQNAMTVLYLTLFIFVASCISIAIVSLLFEQYAWIPIAIDITGICFLFVSCIFLMRESRMAIKAVNHEMDYTLGLFQDKFFKISSRPRWWQGIKTILSRARRSAGQGRSAVPTNQTG
jgi:hypothetical protein